MLKEEIKQDLKKALKEKRKTELSVLRMVLASVLNKEKEKRYRLAKEQSELKSEELEKQSELTDEEIVEVLFSEKKKRKDAIEEFRKGERMDLVRKEEQEIKVLEKYLPEQLSEEEIKKQAQEVIKQMGATGLKDMGKAMSQLMPKLKGRAEGSVVSKIVKELLENQ